MRTALIVLLAIGLIAVAVPATATAHTEFCYLNDAPCIVKCKLHETTGVVAGDHDCVIYGGP